MMNLKTACSLVSGILLFSNVLLASEPDSFTERYMPRKDASSAINHFTQELMAKALRDANLNSIACDKNTLFTSLIKYLKGGFIAGPVENFINDKGDGQIQISRLKRSESIFQYVPFTQNIFMRFSRSTMAAVVDIKKDNNIHYIGSDKFGHFFTEGLTYFTKAFIEKRGIKAAIDWGDKTERGIFGLGTTGVYSYADLVANYQGMIFWANIFSKYAHGNGPYFSCEKGQWKVAKKFDWLDFIDETWDEGINCNAYLTQQYSQDIARRQDELHKEHGFEFRCPLEPRLCINIGKKFGSLKSALINPTCLNIKSDKDVYEFLLSY